MRQHGEGWSATGGEVLVVQVLRERRAARAKEPGLGTGAGDAAGTAAAALAPTLGSASAAAERARQDEQQENNC